MPANTPTPAGEPPRPNGPLRSPGGGRGTPGAAVREVAVPEVAVPEVAVPQEAVAPLIRGIAVLQELTAAGGTMSLSGLERATGLARSTVDRITVTLARMGHVRLDGRDAVLAPPVMELGNSYLAALRLPALLGGRADELADELDESVSLAVADRDGIRFIHQATRRRAMSLSFRIGDLLPAERTAPGPLFATEWTDADWTRWRTRRTTDPDGGDFPALPPRAPDATLEQDFARRADQAARDGWALDDQLIEPGLVAVSVPVRHPGTSRIACVASVVSHTSRRTAEDLRAALLPRLREAADAMQRALHESAPPQPTSPPSPLALWTGASKQELGREFIESLARGLTVLTAFDEGRSELTLTEAARATGLARATTRRALITYEHLGLVTRSPTGAFSLTPRVLALGFPPLSRTTLPRIATPHLKALTELIQESTSLAVLTPSGDEIRCTAGAQSRHVMSVAIEPGTHLPAPDTAAGRLLLEDSPHTLVDEQWEEGLRALAVPVHDRTGRTIAALTMTTHAARRTPEECERDLLPHLRTTAARIESDLHMTSRFTRVPLT
ncbi:helix-turn-helix domain-containing protein [Streptomyces sp. NPDC101166]|uniref:IclR family transcriptional regulator domain-containing protein n=1 Tax=Streptomyces sp. NPDC101166 TaxID=3366120 RepID=UPI003827363D